MGRINVKCPLCGHLNEGVDLEETGGWVECENCKTDFAPGEQLERALKNTRVVTGAADLKRRKGFRKITSALCVF